MNVGIIKSLYNIYKHILQDIVYKYNNILKYKDINIYEYVLLVNLFTYLPTYLLNTLHCISIASVMHLHRLGVKA